MDQVAPETMEGMREWLRQELAGRDQVVAVDDMTDELVLESIDYAFPGGSEAWGDLGGPGATGAPDDHISMVPHGQWAL